MALDVASLPIYDDESKVGTAKPAREVANIYDEAAKYRYRLIDGPIRCARAHVSKYAHKLFDHLTSTTGMLQVSSLAVTPLIGSRLARKVAPVIKNKTYGKPYLAANKAIKWSVPTAVLCYWFETPRTIVEYTAFYTWLGITTTVSWTAWAIFTPLYYVFLYTPYLLIYYTCWGVWTGLSTGAGLVSTAIMSQISPKEEIVQKTEETTEATITESTEEASTESTDAPLNQSNVEAELRQLKRHGAEESEIRITATKEAENAEGVILEEDHGQADEDDKDLYERGR